MNKNENPFEEYVNSQPEYYTEKELNLAEFADFIEGIQAEVKRETRKKIVTIGMVTGMKVVVAIGVIAGVNFLEQKCK
jgi:hypothetical protein